MKFIAMLLSLLAIAAGVPAMAQEGPFTLPSLPYGYDALEPVIDAATMETHHGKHHQAYIDNLNREVGKNPALKDKTLDDILSHITDYNRAVRNNAGGHWNHNFFWSIMAPAGQGGVIAPALADAIDAQFGSFDAFKTAFNAAGTGQFGSGWAWLIVAADGTLKIVSTPNQDNPLMDDAAEKGTPILGNDVWEHAYYLQYRNRRGDYLQNWWDIVNWEQVNRHYENALR